MLGIYCRISREKGNGKDRSIKEQKLSGIALAKKSNLPYKIFIDEGISGTWSLEKRPQFFELIKDLTNKKGEITTVYATDPSRLYRSDETRLSFLSAIKKKNIDLYFENGKFDWSDPYMDFMGKVLSATDVLHVDVTKLKVKAVLKRNAQEGKAHAKVMPLGYTKDEKGYLVIDVDEKSIIEKIYQMCLDGNGSTTIKHWLNNNNVPTRYNKLGGTLTFRNRQTGRKTTKSKKDIIWSDTQVQQILKNPIYKGKRKWGEEYYDCPSIFNEFYWQKVQDQYQKNKDTNNTGKKVDHLYLLKGFLECGECGRNYYGRTRTNKKDNYYMCSSKRYKHEECTNRSINIDVLDSFVWSALFENNIMLEKVEQAFKDGDTDKKRLELENKIIEYRKTLKALNIEYKKSIDLVVRGVVNENDLLDTKNRVIRETNRLNELLTNDEKELNTLSNEIRLLTEIKKDLDFSKQADTDWRLIDELIDNGQFKDIADPKRRKKAKDRYDLLNQNDKDRRRKSEIVENTSYNQKKDVLNKYVKRIHIEYDNQEKVYSIKIAYKLPINNEIYYVDSNYIAVYDPQQKKVLDWYFGGRHFTDKKIEDTFDQLKNYSGNQLVNIT